MKMKYNSRLFKRALAMVLAILPGMLLAQDVKVGDVISGVVTDSEGPMMLVNVIEVDAADRIVSQAVTDIEGNFSFPVRNPKNKIKVSFVGYETVVLPIDKRYFEITMKDELEIGQVDIVADRVMDGLLGIPMKESTSVVHTLNMEDLEGETFTTIDEALAGRIPGLDVVMNSGDLASRSTMHLNGVSTMTGDGNPLIVVDGMILEIESNLKNNFDFQNDVNNDEKLSELLSIHPDDIAKVDVLVDAAATSVWGSRGANGVLQITTKRGKRGSTSVSYSYSLRAQWQPLGYNLLNGDQYTMFLKEAFFNPNMDSELVDDIKEINYDESFSEYRMYNNNTDWVSAVQQLGLNHQHSINVRGGGDKATFYISGNIDTQQGSIIGQTMNRFTTRVNLDYLVSQRIRISTNFSMSYSKNKTNSAALGTAMKMMPNLAIYYEKKNPDPNGEDIVTDEFYHMLPDAGGGRNLLPSNSNPVAEAAEKESYSTQFSVNPGFNINYRVFGLEDSQSQLTYNGAVNFSVSNNDGDTYTPQSLAKNGWSDSNANSISANSNKSSSVTTTHSLTFIPYFKNKNHSVRTSYSFQANMGNGKSQNGGMSGLPSDFKSIGLPGKISSLSTGASRNRGANMTFQSHYSYKSKYNFGFNVRADGSTKFGDAKRWAAFPSLSASWNVSDEKFMEPINKSRILTDLHLQISWGYSGNQPGSDGMYLSKYSSGDSYLGESSMKPDNIRSSNLQWEETSDFSYTANFNLYKNKFSVSARFYDRITTHMIQSGYSIPASSGYSTLSNVNDGTMRNQGWNLSFSASNLITTKILGQTFRMTASANLSDNMNQILELNPTLLEKMTQDFDYKNGSYLTYIALRNAYGSIYGFKYKGVYQYSDYADEEEPGVKGPNAPVARDADGNVIFVEKNGQKYTRPMVYNYGGDNYEFVGGDAIYEDINYDGNINELDIVYLGSSLPKLQGGFQVNFTWGRFTWNNSFTFRYGNRIVNGARMNAECMYNTDNTSAAINWRWRVEGDKTIMPRALYQAGFNYLGSDRYVEDGSFVRWNSMNFGYNFDPKTIKPLHISSLRLGLTMNNIATFTKYTGLDPESAGASRGSVARDNSQTPRSRSLSFTANMSF